MKEGPPAHVPAQEFGMAESGDSEFFTAIKEYLAGGYNKKSKHGLERGHFGWRSSYVHWREGEEDPKAGG